MKALVCLAQKLHKYFVKKMQNLLSFIFLLAFVPSSAFAVTFSNLNITATEFSVDISGNLPGPEPDDNAHWLIITHPNVNTNPGFVLEDFAIAATASFSGSQTVSFFKTGNSAAGDYAWVEFTNVLAGLESLNGTLSGTWSSAVFNPNEASSVNFYYGTDEYGALTTGVFLGSASRSVPDTGSTAALLGVGVIALGFARRRLG